MPPATAARFDSLLVTPRWAFQAWRSRLTRTAPIKPGLDVLAGVDRQRPVERSPHDQSALASVRERRARGMTGASP